jgi:putative hydrolase of the HAD superfamily
MTIKAGIFDLDGTLYFDDQLGREIGRVAAVYMARLQGVEPEAAWALVRQTRKRLAEEQGFEASLSAACLALGGDLRDLHSFFAEEIKPEAYLRIDQGVVETLEALAGKFSLYLYTNNNLTLTTRIMDAIGVSHIFDRVFTIEDFWLAKPDSAVIESVLTAIGRLPGECLFVGDRYDIDLRLPALMGAQVHHVTCREDFMALHKFL